MHTPKTCFGTLFTLLVLGAPAALGDDVLLIPDSSADRIMALSPVDGSLVNPDFITDPGSVGGTDIFNRPLNAIASGNGTILVSDQFSDLVAEFDFSGNFIRVFSNQGTVDTSVMNNIRGIDITAAGEVLVTNSGSTSALALSADNIVQLAASDGAVQPDFAFIRYGGLYGPFDVLVLSDKVLVANETRDNLLQFAPDGSFVRIFAAGGIDFPQQLALTPSNTILVANFSAGNIREYDQTGGLVGTWIPAGLSLYRGVAELDNGQIICTTGAGVYRFTRGSQSSTQILSGSEFRYIERVTLPDKLTLADIRDEDAIARALAVAAQPQQHALVNEDEERGAPVATPDNANHRPRAQSAAAATDTTAATPHTTATPRAAGEVVVYFIEDSGFFGAPGVTPGVVGQTLASDPAHVAILGNAGPFVTWGGLDFLNDDEDAFYGFENNTNSLRAIDFDPDNNLVDSIGYFTGGGAGFTFSPDGTRFYATATAGSIFRIVEAETATADVLSTKWFLTGCSSLAAVPEGTDLPYPAGQLWGLYSIDGAFPTRELHIVQYDYESGTILSDRYVSGIPFEPEFETGLDFTPDGTLYAAVQGYELTSIDPPVAVEVSTHLFIIDPVASSATDLGVIDADQTWDVSGIAVLPPPAPGDLNCDGVIDLFDIDPFVLALTSATDDPPFASYYAAYPDCDPLLADLDASGQVDLFDIDPFVAALIGK